MTDEVVYLDYQATTPVDLRVLEAMSPYWTRLYANPASSHRFGRQAAEGLQAARRQVRTALGADLDSEIVFTSGATEGNHLAVVGAVAGSRHPGTDHVVTTAVEHKSVLAACDRLAASGHTVTTVGVDGMGMVDPQDIATVITPRTVLVSVMHANNEVGTVQPIADIAAITRDRGVLLHVDAAQSVGALDIDVNELGADLLTVSGHKVYGPKGIGALYVRRGTSLRPEYAGSQEYGRRAGTVNLAGAVGLAEALRILSVERRTEAHRIGRLRDTLVDQLRSGLPDITVNGSVEHRLPGNTSLTISGIDADRLIDILPELAISTGSACTGGQADPSHVLTAMGLDATAARATIRLGVGRHTRDEDVEYAARRITTAVSRLRAVV
ncbi:cysteine desulfurase family protein [Saccharothrix isguenensis]